MAKEADLGKALSEIRRRNRWTLSEVSQKTGLSISTLSRVEHSQLSLTYGKLVQLSHGLGVDIAALFDGDTDHSLMDATIGQRSVNLMDDGRTIDSAVYRLIYLNTDLLKKKFVPMFVEPKARSLHEFGELVKHAGDEFSIALEGAIVVHTEHYAPVVLKAGESIYFNSTMGHAYLAHGKGRCRLLSIISAPETVMGETIRQHAGNGSLHSKADVVPRKRNGGNGAKPSTPAAKRSRGKPAASHQTTATAAAASPPRRL